MTEGFESLPLTSEVSDVAGEHDEAGFGRRAVERAVASAGLRSVKRLLDVVRVARAWDGMAARQRSLQVVSDEAGFPSVRTLVEQFHFFVGIPPRRSRKQADGREFAARLVVRLLDRGIPAVRIAAPATEARPPEQPTSTRNS